MLMRTARKRFDHLFCRRRIDGRIHIASYERSMLYLLSSTFDPARFIRYLSIKEHPAPASKSSKTDTLSLASFPCAQERALRVHSTIQRNNVRR